MKIRFLGAAGTVTGSKHLVETGSHRFLVDCGLFQGHKELRERNWSPLPVDPASVDAVLLTHAHIDHTGYLPRFCRDGFTGEVHATNATRDLLSILLPDSAHIQEEQATYMNRKRITKHSPALPLYTLADAEYALRRLRGPELMAPIEVVPGVQARFHEAGHILGSAWIELEVEGRRIVFSGDLGRAGAPIMRDPEPPGAADLLVVESTYGSRLHGEHDRAADLARVIKETVARRGVLLIPAFAVERTQEIIYILQLLRRGKEIPPIPVAIDSPMAIRSTRVFDKYPGLYDEETARLRAETRDLFTGYPGLRLCESVEESKAIAAMEPPFIVISASGMCEAGRILHHLRHYLPGARNTVLLVGFQVPGTRGWRLQEGEPSVKIFGEWIDVKARIERLEGFSGHADHSQIVKWLDRLKAPPDHTFLVHGNPEALEAQRARFAERGWNVHVPGQGEIVEV
jgi:metallo-beta-lactamase family protein